MQRRVFRQFFEPDAEDVCWTEDRFFLRKCSCYTWYPYI